MSNFAVSQKAGCEEIIQKLDNPKNLQIKTKCFPDWVDSSLAAQRAEEGGCGFASVQILQFLSYQLYSSILAIQISTFF